MVQNYTAPHILITVQGDAWTSTETWQFGVRVIPTNVIVTDSDCQNLANNLAAPTQAMFTAAALKIGVTNRLMAIKVARINEDGHYPPDHNPGVYTYPTPIAAPAGQAGLPQATMCVTLLTNLPRGLASRGRFFLPNTNLIPSGDGRITTVEADSIESLVRTWLLAVNASSEVDAIAVFSGLREGRTAVVNRIGVGRVIDTMRSRRRSLAELRSPLNL